MLKIVLVPDKVLLSPTKPVENIDDKVKQLIFQMEKTLVAHKDPKGVGLAANQVGVNLSLFIIKSSEKAKIKVFINPKILKVQAVKKSKPKSKKTKRKQPVRLEGCLSIPKIWGPVKRAKKIYLEYQDLESSEIKRKWFQGFEATIIQHEIDHLKGTVFTARSMEQGGVLYKEEGDELKPFEI